MGDRFIQINAEEDYEGMRVDKFITEHDELSRSFVQKLIKNSSVSVNSKPVKASYMICTGDVIELTVPAPFLPDICPENIPLDIKYEDDYIIIVNKPKGMVVHPAAGNYSGTLVNALMYHCNGHLSGINGIMRPGIVHRIDKDTTGLLVVCKNDLAHRSVSEQLKEHSITRRYQAIVYGCIKDEDGIIDAPIGRHPVERKKMAVNYQNGKQAVTHYHVLDNIEGGYSHIECRLETGRTHQIRVHMSSIKHPLLGDTVYGPSNDSFHLQGQALHAGVLGLIHPATHEYMEFITPPPPYFNELLNKLRKQ